MIPTPDLSHIKRQDYQHIYEPAEDTFLLLDALEEEAEFLRTLSPSICLEIGCGSGCVSAFASRALQPLSVLSLCTDINPVASRCTALTGVQNGALLDTITADLAIPLAQRLKGSVDVILFNPPYVPTWSEEAVAAQTHAGIAGSWAGGVTGMEVTDRFLDQVEMLLSAKGVFYLVAVRENNVPAIRSKMLQDHGLQSEITLERRAGREYLYIVKFYRSN